MLDSPKCFETSHSQFGATHLPFVVGLAFFDRDAYQGLVVRHACRTLNELSHQRGIGSDVLGLFSTPSIKAKQKYFQTRLAG
jgi:hypothetical protein